MQAMDVESGTRRKVLIASVIGTTVEWYDFTIYGIAAALVLGPQFFPRLSETAGLLAAFATFGVGFIARPLGAALFGHYGDRIGRKSALVWSLLLMGLGTLLIGCLPGYDKIGVAAPILLVTLRFVQGIGIGGEWGGAALLAAEYAPAKKRGLYVAWPQFGNPAGLLLGNAVFLLCRTSLGKDSFLTWGWRIPFIASAVLIVIGFAVRFALEETPAFKKAARGRSIERAPLVTVLQKHLGKLLLIGGAFLLNNTAFYIVTTYTLAYVRQHTGQVDPSLALGAQIAGAAVLAAGILFFSWLSDRIGRKWTVLPLYAAWIVWIWPMFWLLKSGSPSAFIIAVVVGSFLTSAYGPLGAFLLEQFDTRIRYTGGGVGMQLGAIFGGGLSPIVATQLNASFGLLGVQIYIAAVAVISAACVIALKDAARVSIDALDEPGADTAAKMAGDYGGEFSVQQGKNP
jgi:metabolite-proton symporter